MADSCPCFAGDGRTRVECDRIGPELGRARMHSAQPCPNSAHTRRSLSVSRRMWPRRARTSRCHWHHLTPSFGFMVSLGVGKNTLGEGGGAASKYSKHTPKLLSAARSLDGRRSPTPKFLERCPTVAPRCVFPWTSAPKIPPNSSNTTSWSIFRPIFAHRPPNSANLRQVWSSLDQIWANLGQSFPQFGQSWAALAECWPNSAAGSRTARKTRPRECCVSDFGEFWGRFSRYRCGGE